MKIKYVITSLLKMDGANSLLISELNEILSGKKDEYGPGFKFLTKKEHEFEKLIDIFVSFGFQKSKDYSDDGAYRYQVGVIIDYDSKDFQEAPFVLVKETKSEYKGKRPTFLNDGILVEKKSLKPFKYIQEIGLMFLVSTKFKELVENPTTGILLKKKEPKFSGVLFSPVYTRSQNGHIQKSDDYFWLDSPNITGGDENQFGVIYHHDGKVKSINYERASILQYPNLNKQDLVISCTFPPSDERWAFNYREHYFSRRFYQFFLQNRIRDIIEPTPTSLEEKQDLDGTFQKAFEEKLATVIPEEVDLDENIAPSVERVHYFNSTLDDLPFEPHKAECAFLGAEEFCLQVNELNYKLLFHIPSEERRQKFELSYQDNYEQNVSLKAIKQGLILVLHEIVPCDAKLESDGSFSANNVPEIADKITPKSVQKLMRTPPLLEEESLWYHDKNGNFMDFIGRWSSDQFTEFCPAGTKPQKFFKKVVSGLYSDDYGKNFKKMDNKGTTLMFKSDAGEYIGIFNYDSDTL